MSREIKYRAWVKKDKEIVEILYLETREDGLVAVLYKDNSKITLGKYAIKIMQYTGLKDSEGYEIYENDIVWNEYDEEYQVVIFDEGEYKLKGETSAQNLYDSLDYIDIRGNVYEDFEIIKAWYKEE